MIQIRRPLTRAVFAVSAALLVATAVPHASQAVAWQPTTAVTAKPANALRWSRCYEGVRVQYDGLLPPDEYAGLRFECATAKLPLDYDRPNGPKVGIALVRMPALDTANRIGSMFVNPGGPGGSGVEMVLGAGPMIYSTAVRSRFDIIGFDPRGISRSTPLECFPNERSADRAMRSGIPAFPATPSEVRAWDRDTNRLLKACSKNAGPIIDHMSTANVARDLDSMRAMVGDEQLTYHGLSYGTFLGNTYANLFPDRVRAVVLDAVVDPISWTTGHPGDENIPVSARLGSYVDAQATMQEFFRLCDEAGPNCAISSTASARYEAVLDRLATVPYLYLDAQGRVQAYGQQNLVVDSLNMLYRSDNWPRFAAWVATLEAQVMASPVPAPAAPGAAPSLRVGKEPPWEKRLAKYRNDTEGQAGVMCSDSNNPTKVSDWVNAAGTFSPSNLFQSMWTWVSSACKKWPGHDTDRYMGPFTASTAHTVLVMSTTFDPATPLAGAQLVASLLPNSHLLTINGWGHGSLLLSTCATEAFDEYLLTAVAPTVTNCTQDRPVFATKRPLTVAASRRAAAEQRALDWLAAQALPA